MKMLELTNAAPAIHKLSMQDLPIRAAYEVSRIVRQTREHLEFYDQKHNEIVEKHYKQKDGKWEPKSLEDRVAFETEMADLLDLEVDIGEIKKPVLSIDKEGITISAADLLALEGTFIEIQHEDEETKEENDNGNP